MRKEGEPGANSKIMKKIMPVLLFVLVGTLYYCSDKLSNPPVKEISYEIFTTNCEADIEEIKATFSKILSGYTVSFEKKIDEKKFGFIIDEDSSKILSNLVIFNFERLSNSVLNEFIEQNGGIVIGEVPQYLNAGHVFCVQNTKTKQIFICSIYPANDGKGHFFYI